MVALQNIHTELANDPLGFCQLAWPDEKLYTKQKEALESLVDSLETFVHTGNELGKTNVAAKAIILRRSSWTAPCGPKSPDTFVPQRSRLGLK
jgi:hypothetical protein